MKFDVMKLQPGDPIQRKGKRGVYRFGGWKDDALVILYGPVTVGMRAGHDHRSSVVAACELRPPGRQHTRESVAMHAGLHSLSDQSKRRKR